MIMSNTNSNLRSLRDRFQQQQEADSYVNFSNHLQEQKHDIRFQCIHCGKHQTVTFQLQSNVTKGASRNMNQCPCPQNFFAFFENCKPLVSFCLECFLVFAEKAAPSTFRESPVQERRSSAIVRPVSVISEEGNDVTPPVLHRSNYALDFRQPTEEKLSRKSLEQNVKGFIDGCVRSSLHEISNVTSEPETQEVVEVEVEYDPILGNVKATRKRSSTMITSLDNDYRSPNQRPQSVHSRSKALTIDSEHDTAPIWARRRISHSTVKPSDLVREKDKKDKLEPNALRRLSRSDLVEADVVPNSTIRPTIRMESIFSSQNPSMIKDTVLRWCQDLTQFYKGVNIRNFSSSWTDGLAFCAIVHRYFPDEFNFETLNANEPRQNFDLAFAVASERAGIEPLIDTDDMIFMGNKPDWKVVFTYVQSLYRHLSRTQPPAIMRERW